MTLGESWPRPGYALVPARLRLAWLDEALPESVVRRAGLPADTRVGDLDERIWEKLDDPGRLVVVANYVLSLVRSRLYHRGDEDLADTPLIRGAWPTEADPKDLPLSRRTRNLLAKVPADGRQKWLSGLSASSFLSVRGAGPVSLLEFLTVVDVMVKPAAVHAKSKTEELRETQLALEVLRERYPIHSISSRDPRIPVLGLSSESIGEALEGQLARAQHSGGNLTEAQASIKAVSRELAILGSETLDEALGRVLRLCTPSHLEGLAARLGWDGRGGTSLQEAGDRAGLTRERIRQLEKKVRDVMSHISFFPAIDRAIEILDAAAARFEADADTLLAEEGVCNIKFRPKGVATAAEFLGRKHLFRIGEDGVCVQLEGDKDLKPLRNALLSLTDVNHVAPVPELQARVSEATGREPTVEAIRHFLDRHPRIVWLDSEHNWFWDGTARLRYNNYARKVLAISNPISIESLRDGVLRHHRARNMSLPRSTFEGLCRALGFDVRDGMVSMSEMIQPKDVLGSIELEFVTVLKENQNVLNGKAFRDKCYSKGVNRHSFWAYLSYSPILERLAPGVYSLRGADIDPARVAHLMGRTSETRGALQDHGWTRDGSIWLGYTVTDNLRDSGVVTIPAAVRRLLGSQRLEAVAVDGTPMGTLMVGTGSSAGSAWGLGPFITRRGVDLGDSLILTIDTELEIACVQAGSKDLLVGFQEGEGWGPQHYLEEATRPGDSAEAEIGSEYRSSGAA